MFAAVWNDLASWATALFGSWPNATQGSVGAFASVAAAVLVVRLTRNHERKLVLESDARRAVATLLSEVRPLLSECKTADQARLADIVNDVSLAAMITGAFLKPVSKAAALGVQDAFYRLIGPHQQYGEIDRDMLERVLLDLLAACSEWVADEIGEPRGWARRSSS